MLDLNKILREVERFEIEKEEAAKKLEAESIIRDLVEEVKRLRWFEESWRGIARISDDSGKMF